MSGFLWPIKQNIRACSPKICQHTFRQGSSSILIAKNPNSKSNEVCLLKSMKLPNIL